MGPFTNQRITTATAGLIVGIIIALNIYLLHITFAG
jgi:Mn2+/Fe2+ NRAMP family transporter